MAKKKNQWLESRLSPITKVVELVPLHSLEKVHPSKNFSKILIVSSDLEIKLIFKFVNIFSSDFHKQALSSLLWPVGLFKKKANLEAYHMCWKGFGMQGSSAVLHQGRKLISCKDKKGEQFWWIILA